MSRSSKGLSAARLNDSILGCFSHVQPSETLDHLVRYLGTWSGSDKLFMVIQYALKLIVPFLHLRARLQHRAGLRKTPTSNLAVNYGQLASTLGEARRLWGIWGILPIYQWLISLERRPSESRKILTIERLQGWAMILFFPLEHLSYLASHNILPAGITSPLSLFSSKKRKINLNPGTLSMWSCRLWGAYVLLHFAHLFEDRKLILQRYASMRRANGGTGLSDDNKAEMKQRWDAYWSEVVINLGYLPLTVHWSLEKGLFTNEVWVGVFGLIAAVASFRSGWKATAISPAPSSPPVEQTKENAIVSSPNSPYGYEIGQQSN
ncbi:hypothetical protein CPB83DRAFT_757093 [Crepidotus variabilis]|uniref:Uncharacterized protein n=1 Tax=Crepidotus variabilis TaxID=179855 RepID=A0A9P6EQ07_9AGAR|nr:hypothetical protein CPB83DRAFT_757093 [Crepidotus variabilis]